MAHRGWRTGGVAASTAAASARLTRPSKVCRPQTYEAVAPSGARLVATAAAAVAAAQACLLLARGGRRAHRGVWEGKRRGDAQFVIVDRQVSEQPRTGAPSAPFGSRV
eukprot:364343-Chlamydomonas_euryale.AAC.2